jgi:pimeloyl-ACP methyl ester carboxylesterase
MEQLTFQNSRSLRLVGNLYRAESTAMVVMVHGFGSDKHSRGRFPYIAQALNRLDINALAFDCSGCGESEDDTLTMAKLTEDVQAAIAFVVTQGFDRLALWGHSLGGRLCLEASTPAVRTMVLTGAATGLMHYRWEDYYSPEQLQELATTGRLTESRSAGPRRQIIIEAPLLHAFAAVNQHQLLERVSCPVLLIHGDGDDEERQWLALSRIGLTLLPAGSRLEVISGATHSFLDHIEQVTTLGTSWIAKVLAEATDQA